MASPIVSVNIEAKYESLVQQLAQASAAVKDGARAMAESVGHIAPAGAHATSSIQTLSEGAREWRRSVREDARYTTFFAGQLSLLGLEAKGVGGTLAALGAGFAFGGAAGVAVETVKLLAEQLGAASKEAAALEQKKLEKFRAEIDATDKVVAGLVEKLLGLHGFDPKEVELTQAVRDAERVLAGERAREAELQRQREEGNARLRKAGLDPQPVRAYYAAEETAASKALRARENALREYKAAKDAVDTKESGDKGTEEREKAEQAHVEFMLQQEMKAADTRTKIVMEGRLEEAKALERSREDMQGNYDSEIAKIREVTAEKLRLHDLDLSAKLATGDSGWEEDGARQVDLLKLQQADYQHALEASRKKMEQMQNAGRSMGNAVGNAFAGMISGAMSFGQALGSMLKAAIGAIMQYVIASITAKAASAAAGAAESQSMIPVIGPALAIAAAAAMGAFVMGLLPSAAGGFDIGNFNPITQLHAGEMVLPAPLADKVREGAGGATYNIKIVAHDAQSFERYLSSGPGAAGFVRAMQTLARSGRV